MKKILFVVQGAAGGVSRYLVDIISNMPENQYQIAIVFNSQDEDERFRAWRNNQSNVLFYDLSTLRRDLSLINDAKSILSIIKIIQEFQPNVVHAQSSKAGMVGRIAAKLCRVDRIIYTPHAYAFMSPEFSERKRKLFIIAERVLSKLFTDRTINCSHSENRHAIAERIDSPQKFVVIPNAVKPVTRVDRAEQRQKLNVENHKLIVANFARVSRQKNPDLYIAIAEKTQMLNSNVEFLWIGSNSTQKASDFVHFVGEKSDTQQLMSGVNLILSTSFFEGLSYSLLEAASVGVPVLASNVPGNDEFIESYSRAFGFNLTDSTEKIARTILQLLNNTAILNEPMTSNSFELMLNETLKQYD